MKGMPCSYYRALHVHTCSIYRYKVDLGAKNGDAVLHCEMPSLTFITGMEYGPIHKIYI